MSTQGTTESLTNTPEITPARGVSNSLDTAEVFLSLEPQEIGQIQTTLRAALNRIISQEKVLISDDPDSLYSGSEIIPGIDKDLEPHKFQQAVDMLLKQLIRQNRNDVYNTVVKILVEKTRLVRRHEASQASQPSVDVEGNEASQSTPSSPIPPPVPPPVPDLPPQRNTQRRDSSPNNTASGTDGTPVPAQSFRRTRWTFRQFVKTMRWMGQKLDYLDIGNEKYFLRPPKS